jgi:cytochrome c-type biogenesis protein CcmH
LCDDDEQVVSYIVARYGNYVLLKPPLQADTFILWFAPFAMMAIALGVTLAYFARRPPLADNAVALSPDDIQDN